MPELRTLRRPRRRWRGRRLLHVRRLQEHDRRRVSERSQRPRDHGVLHGVGGPHRVHGGPAARGARRKVRGSSSRFRGGKGKPTSRSRKALADAEEKKKLAILEEKTAKANEDAAKVLAEASRTRSGTWRSRRRSASAATCSWATPSSAASAGSPGRTRSCWMIRRPAMRWRRSARPAAISSWATASSAASAARCGSEEVADEGGRRRRAAAEGGFRSSRRRRSSSSGGSSRRRRQRRRRGGAATKDKTRVVLFTSSGRPIRPADPVLKVKPLDEAGKRELSQRARLDAYLAVSWERHMRRERNAQRRDKLIAQAQSGVLGKMMMNTALGGGGSVAGSTGSGGYNGGRQRQQQAGDGGRRRHPRRSGPSRVSPRGHGVTVTGRILESPDRGLPSAPRVGLDGRQR